MDKINNRLLNCRTISGRSKHRIKYMAQKHCIYVLLIPPSPKIVTDGPINILCKISTGIMTIEP